MKASQPLVTYTRQSGYRVEPKALAFLQSLSNKFTYSILTVVGKCKTGKSFLLNQLLRQEIFPTSSYLDSCTKGIMISDKIIEFNGQKVIVLDTQGFGGVGSTDNIDYKILMLAVMISSSVIYNSVGTIDQHALGAISMIIEVGKALEKQLLKDGFFSCPSLIWVLRDFSLAMQDKNGDPISSKKYLQNALEEQKGNSDQINNKNRIRRVIKSLFPIRTCQTLVIPTNSEKELFQPQINPENYREQFLNGINQLRNEVFKLVEKCQKKICKQTLTIPLLINSLQIIVEALNNNKIPNIQNISSQIIKKQIQTYTQKLNTSIEQLKKNFLSSSITLSSASQQCIDIFNFYRANLKQSIGQDNLQASYQRQTEIIKQLEQISNNKRQQNKQISLKQVGQKICGRIQAISNLAYLDQQYLKLTQALKSNQNCEVSKRQLDKIQITYLRKKLKLSEQMLKVNSDLQKQLESANRQIKNLKKQLRNNSSLYSEMSEPNNFPVIDSHLASYSTQKSECKQNRGLNNYISNSSLYIPYVVISESSLIKIDINKTLIKQDHKHSNYIEYVLQVNFMSQKWSFNRKYKDFVELENIIKVMFPKLTLPTFKNTLTKILSQINSYSKEKIQQRRKQLKNYLYELNKIQNIRNSRIFQKFIRLNKQCLDKLY